MALDLEFRRGPIGGLPFPIFPSDSTFSLMTRWGSATRNYPHNTPMDWGVGRSTCLALCKQWASCELILWGTRWVPRLHLLLLSLIPNSLTGWCSWVQWASVFQSPKGSMLSGATPRAFPI